MRIIPILLTVLLIISARCISADEYVLGRVVSIDRSRGTVAVEVLDGNADLMRTDRGRARPPGNDPRRRPQSPPAVIIIDRHLLPDTITLNSTVRIRGSFDANGRPLNPPNPPDGKMQGPPDSHIQHHDDTTGVRHRIEKGSKPGVKQSPPKGGNGSHRKGGHGGGHHGR